MPAADHLDTIAAIATAPGRGGIGIVRLSGPDARSLAEPLLRGLDRPLAHRQACFFQLVEPETGARLDEAVVTYFGGPNSYTGEDVVEIAAHGSPVVLAHLLRLLVRRGARLATAGEFTERAFHAGRLDLTQAEAVRDLIDAQTLLQAQLAAEQLGGALARRIQPLKQTLVALIAMLEAGIDFAEDDTPVISEAALALRLTTLQAELAVLEQSFARGRVVTEGVKLAIVGRPNVGKSSLFNRLLDRERAIVTSEPGTTRDTVNERLAIGGVPVELIDTAGLREADGEAERIGIAKSREAFAEAGLVLLVLDSTSELDAEEETLLRAAAGRPLLIAHNKCDLLSGTAPTWTKDRALAAEAARYTTSAHTGEGLVELRRGIEALLLGSSPLTPESAMLTNLRQHTAVAAAFEATEKAREAAETLVPHELLLLDLYEALASLDSLTGVTTPDDVLGLIFSTFCIGK